MPSSGLWDKLTGQQKTVDLLRSKATLETPNHAWLFTGPPGSGRSTAAQVLAASLECLNPTFENKGCDECLACTQVMANTHPDVTILNTDKVIISVDQVRQLISTSQNAPSEGNWRIIIIEDADRMQEKTTNVLLKALEEPPPRTIWMLCAPSTQDVLPTIRSRTHHVNLKIPEVQDIAQDLVTRSGIDHSIAYKAARLSQGHIGIARRLALDESARIRREEIVNLTQQLRGVGDAFHVAQKMLELADEENTSLIENQNIQEKNALLSILGYGEKERIKPADRGQVKQLEEDQKRRLTRSKRDTLDRYLTDLQSFYRDVLIIQLSRTADSTSSHNSHSSEEPSRTLINIHLEEPVKDLAQKTQAETTLDKIDAITQARDYIAANVDSRLALEDMAVKLL